MIRPTSKRADVASPATGDQWLSPTAAGKTVPGGPIVKETIIRWIRDGVVVRRAGERTVVRLAAKKIGGRWRIRYSGLMEFLTATTAGAAGPPEERKTTPQARRTVRQARTAQTHAMNTLAKLLPSAKRLVGSH